MGEDGAVSGHMLRSSKSQSMYGKIEPVLPNSGDPKACTLPPNFAPGSKVQYLPFDLSVSKCPLLKCCEGLPLKVILLDEPQLLIRSLSVTIPSLCSFSFQMSSLEVLRRAPF